MPPPTGSATDSHAPDAEMPPADAEMRASTIPQPQNRIVTTTLETTPPKQRATQPTPASSAPTAPAPPLGHAAQAPTTTAADHTPNATCDSERRPQDDGVPSNRNIIAMLQHVLNNQMHGRQQVHGLVTTLQQHNARPNSSTANGTAPLYPSRSRCASSTNACMTSRAQRARRNSHSSSAFPRSKTRTSTGGRCRQQGMHPATRQEDATSPSCSAASRGTFRARSSRSSDDAS